MKHCNRKEEAKIPYHQLRRLVMLLRFGSYDPQPMTKPIINIKTIAQSLKISSYKVQSLV